MTLILPAAIKPDEQGHPNRKRGYANDTERNVHIWAHPLEDTMNIYRRKIHLVAGFYNHDNRVTYKTLYEWIDEVLEPPLDGQWLLLRWGSRANGELQPKFQVSCDWDPQLYEHTFPGAIVGDPSCLNWANVDLRLEDKLVKLTIPRSDQSSCLAGHYMLVAGTWLSGSPYIYPPVDGLDLFAEPVLRKYWNLVALIRPKKEEEEGKKEKENEEVKRHARSAATRVSVRERDGCCRVSGQKPALRKRGDDYTALEVAHIFPLGYAGRDDVISLFSDQGGAKILPLIRNHKVADNPYNAILLRSDIHKFFDTFQWGVWKGETYTFEKNGPASLPNTGPHALLPPNPNPKRPLRKIGPEEKANMEELLRVQFITHCVLTPASQGSSGCR